MFPSSSPNKAYGCRHSLVAREVILVSEDSSSSFSSERISFLNPIGPTLVASSRVTSGAPLGKKRKEKKKQTWVESPFVA